MSEGHGHVRPRQDGTKERCGGPGLCAECTEEQAALDAEIVRRPIRAGVDLVGDVVDGTLGIFSPWGR